MESLLNSFNQTVAINNLILTEDISNPFKKPEVGQNIRELEKGLIRKLTLEVLHIVVHDSIWLQIKTSGEQLTWVSLDRWFTFTKRFFAEPTYSVGSSDWVVASCDGVAQAQAL